MYCKLVGFTKEGYHRTLATLSEKQIHMTHGEVREATASELDGTGINISVVIDLKDFPEMDRFAVVVMER